MGNIAIGSNTFSNVKLGNNQIKSVYLGNNLVWSNFKYLLDEYPTPAYHAYSLRKLKLGYTGFCLRIRRTTSSPTVITTTVDLRFDIDTNTINFNSSIQNVSGVATNATTLGEFAAGTVDGFTASNINVVTWYDQSGNGKNVIQATPTSQPFLVTNGVLETVDGSVAVKFLVANTNSLVLTDSSVSYNNLSIYNVSVSTTSNIVNNFMLGNTANNRLYISNAFTSYVSLNTFNTTGASLGVTRLVEVIAGASTTSVYAGGPLAISQGTPLTVASAAVRSNTIRIGASGGTLQFWNGHMKEVISFQGFPSKTGVEDNINSYYNIW